MTDSFNNTLNYANNITRLQRNERIGEIHINIQNEKMKIIEYRTSTDIDIMFHDTKNVLKHQTYSNFKKGTIIDSYKPTVFNCGIIGNESITDSDKNLLKSYLSWVGMLKRCYNKKDLVRYPSYDSCYVCEEWLYYKNYKQWFDEHYYLCGNEKMTLDKDILHKNNKEYCPQKCIFVPERINILFTKTNKTRGEYPIGVYYKKKNRKYVAQISKLSGKNKKQQEYLGLYNTPEEAFQVYKNEKEKYIKQVADEYKNKYSNFPKDLYDALYRYEVEITD